MLYFLVIILIGRRESELKVVACVTQTEVLGAHRELGRFGYVDLRAAEQDDLEERLALVGPLELVSLPESEGRIHTTRFKAGHND